MKTVPLHGQKAAGRVALVDDEDYDLVMQYRWHVYEKPATATRRACGPYAEANAGHRHTIRMHGLILGIKGIDHVDHDGLNNQRYNLRPATTSQNGANQRPQKGRSSDYKGVSWDRRRKGWRGFIKVHQKYKDLGLYASETEAAYAYDAAAREAFGEFACTNFPEGPSRATLDQWQAAREERKAIGVLNHAQSRTCAGWWAEREPETRTCEECGKKYQSKSTRSSYCSKPCGWLGWKKRQAEREREGRLF